ncbi:Beta-arrestin [Fasciolopsis buskii]|uniref:Beta-arrestin n=1 Tax=Fasciolopsis buskii TaxID=27845 RepID=A0A8E0RZ01_9TREM|nr:Beta-arrestin [Fasciolopsis buski]
MPSSKRSPKQSPKKDGKGSPGKKSPKFTAEDQAACDRFFARRRYEDMDAVFKQKGPVITIYASSIHLYEIWNRLPPYEQFNCSASPKKSPKSGKSSPKKSPKGGASKLPGAAEEESKPEFEPATITGIICIHKSHLSEGKKLFAEVTAEFRYCGHSRVPPYPDNVVSTCQCFRDNQHIYPVTFDEEIHVSNFNQQLIYKLHRELGRGYRLFPYIFDVTRKPDSVFFTRPYYPDFSSGVFWKLRAYLAPEEDCEALPGQQTVMEFFKYTICPALTPYCLRETQPVAYTRYCTQGDTGDLILQAQLDRDIYYHGQEIKVKIAIENNSSRHVVDMIAVFVEQTYRLFHQFPHDTSIRLNEVLIQQGDPGMPINPRSRNFTKDVLIKPEYDQTKYNLAIDGKMSVDKKVFLANSTVIMHSTQVAVATVEDPEQPATGSGKNSPKGSPGKSGSPKEKNKSPKQASPAKSKSKSPKKETSPAKKNVPVAPSAQNAPTEEPEPITEPRLVITINEVNQLTNKQVCRSVFIAYDVVVRVNLRTPVGDEAGHPEVRLPFILTRETRYLDKLSNPPPPPVWGTINPH